jgi:hypothetical protein
MRIFVALAVLLPLLLLAALLARPEEPVNLELPAGVESSPGDLGRSR